MKRKDKREKRAFESIEIGKDSVWTMRRIYSYIWWKNPLETTAVHPESYDIAEKLLALIGYKRKI